MRNSRRRIPKAERHMNFLKLLKPGDYKRASLSKEDVTSGTLPKAESGVVPVSINFMQA